MTIRLEREKGWRDFSQKLPPEYNAVRKNKQALSIVLLDSFDWRVYNSGHTLRLADGLLQLRAIEDGLPVFESRQRKGVLSVWPKDVKDAHLSAWLADVLDVRALLVHSLWQGSSEEFDLLNTDRKTIARGIFYNLNNGNAGLRLLEVQPLRGYEQVCEVIFAPWKILAADNSDSLLYAEAGVVPGGYRGSRPELDFSQESSLSAALKEILTANFKMMLLNEPGVREDIDTEFLHDYRVCGRRMRSALSRIKGVLKEETVLQLQNDLKRIGNFTGPVRDWDVFLLRRAGFESVLPPQFHKGLGKLMSNCARRRSMAFSSLHSFLESKEYSQIIARIDATLSDYEHHLVTDADLKTSAARWIKARFKKIRKQGAELSDEAGDSAFHDLRIECKKLRYLLEFFQSAFKEKPSRKAIAMLKKLQDNLGSMNDMSVQEELLTEIYLTAKKKNQAELTETAAALIGHTRTEKKRLRRDFRSLFSGFASSKSRHLYKSSFTVEGE